MALDAIGVIAVKCWGCSVSTFARSLKRRGRVYVDTPLGWYVSTEEDGRAFLCGDCAEPVVEGGGVVCEDGKEGSV